MKKSLKKEKLLIVKFPLQSAWGGEEEIHLLLAKKLRENNHEIALLTSCPYLIKGFHEQNFYTKKGVHYPDPVSKKALLLFPFTAIYFFFVGIYYLAFFRFKGYREILFLRFGEKILWTPLAKLMGYKKVFWGEHCMFSRWILKNPLLPVWKLVSRFAEFIAPSKIMQEQIRKTSKSTIHLLPNALSEEKDLSQKIPSKKPLIDLLNKKFIQQFKETDTFIVYAGRLSNEKGLPMLIESTEKILKKNDRTFLLLAGEGSERNHLEQIVKAKSLEDKVFFLGFLETENLSRFYLGVDIFCLFSDFESFGLALLEAMSAQLPVIATKNGAIPELIQNNKNGLLIENKKQAEEAIKKLIADKALREKLGKYGRNFYKNNFTAKVFAERAEKIFFPN